MGILQVVNHMFYIKLTLTKNTENKIFMVIAIS